MPYTLVYVLTDMMRRYKSYFLAVTVAASLAACNDDEPIRVDSPLTLIPKTFVEADLTKSLVYDDANRLVEIHFITKYPNGTTSTSVQTFVYNEEGKLAESTTDTGWRYVYTYDNHFIIRTDEYIQDTHSDYHLFKYDNKSRLIERVTYQDIPEEGGEIPVAKDTFTYDSQGNLEFQRLYYYTSYGLEAKLLTELAFSDYDDKVNSEEYFDVMGINPLIRLRKHNPSKMIVKNQQGNITSTETYAYTYHPKGYAVAKKARIVLYNGNEGSYEATYLFEER